MRGLLAIEPLYHQIVKGNKTQTRRSGGLNEVNVKPDNWEITGHTGDENQLEEVDFCDYMDTQRNIHCKPRYKIGEILYLKEPLIIMGGEPLYKFDLPLYDKAREYIRFSNKLFMPAKYARAFVKITGIKCERLWDISDEDCIAEGIEQSGYGDAYINYLMHTGYGYDYVDNDPRTSFFSLYKLANKLAKVGSVEPHGSLPTPPGVDNIWVWAYTFEYLKDYKP